MKKLIYLLLLALLPLGMQAAKAGKKNTPQKVRVACVGNSVTFGYALRNPATQSYPTQLQTLLGDGYEVRNFGHSGATLLRHGHRPYVKTPEYQQAIDFKADLVVIHLGLNDTDPRNWPDYAEEFIGDYRNLINDFKAANANAKVWVCLMTPIFHGHPRFQSGTRDWHAAIQKAIRKVAGNGVGLIDLNTPLYNHPELFPDALHPNVEGAGIIARTVYGAITGNYGPLTLSPMYGNGMVVQRRQPITFHGTASAGTSVRVTFNRLQLTTTAAPNGEWEVRYPEMEAGGPYSLSFETMPAKGKGKLLSKPTAVVNIDSVWVGDVWLCSGQSNMEFTLQQTTTAQEDKARFAQQSTTQAGAKPYLAYCDMSTRFPTDNVEWSEETLSEVNHLKLLQQPRWQQCTQENVGRFSAIAALFGRMLADSLRIPIGIICNAVGGTTTEAWIDRATLEWEMPNILNDWYHADYGQAWARGRALKNIAKAPNTKLQRHPYEPAYMFEAGIMPLNHYKIKGVVWYQGESNANNIELHERLFTLLEKSWRNFFGNPQLPFYTTQLSGLNRPSWPRFRNSQRLLAEQLPQTWMAVTHDMGDPADVHYPNKRPVAERLARLALAHTYSQQVAADAPEVVSVHYHAGEVRLVYKNATRLVVKGEQLLGFEVAGADGIYHEAKATVDGNSVTLSSPEVTAPVSFRYAWQPYTKANLYNQAGVPASTYCSEE